MPPLWASTSPFPLYETNILDYKLPATLKNSFIIYNVSLNNRIFNYLIFPGLGTYIKELICIFFKFFSLIIPFLRFSHLYMHISNSFFKLLYDICGISRLKLIYLFYWFGTCFLLLLFNTVILRFSFSFKQLKFK